MALIKCPECGKEFSDQASACPSCGMPNNPVVPPVQPTPQQPIPPVAPKEKTYKTARLIIGIISIVLFFLVSFQSCAAGISNTLSANGEISGTAGLLLSLCMLISGIVTICLKNKKTNTAFVVPAVFYLFGSLVAAGNIGNYGDLQIWTIISALFGALHLYYLFSIKHLNQIVRFAVPVCIVLLFVGLTSVGNNTESELDAPPVTETSSIEESVSSPSNDETETSSVDLSEKVSSALDSASDFTEKLTVTGEYFYSNIFASYYFLTVRNDSDTTLEISDNVVVKDESGASVGADSASADAIAPGNEVCLTHIFDELDNADSFEYTLEASKETFYKPISDDISIEVNDTGSKVVVTGTNNGEDALMFVEAYALFLKDGNVVEHGSTYITDDDGEIKTGKTIASEITSYEFYDEAKVFITGYKY